MGGGKGSIIRNPEIRTGEIRNPKSEIRRKSEIRNPKAEVADEVGVGSAFNTEPVGS
jgi:hypothetical protein